jgi:hypothetical protein
MKFRIRAMVENERQELPREVDFMTVDAATPDDCADRTRFLFVVSRMSNFKGVRPDFVQVVDTNGVEVFRWDAKKEEAAKREEDVNKRREEAEMLRN